MSIGICFSVNKSLADDTVKLKKNVINYFITTPDSKFLSAYRHLKRREIEEALITELDY